jgi:hypothetical protein
MDLQELDALLDGARLPEATVPLCLRGDLQARREALEGELAARVQMSATMADGRAAELRRELGEVVEAMRAGTIVVTLRALESAEWKEFIAEHPPREGERVDQVLGVNNSTFFPALVRRSLVDPVIPEDRLERLLGKLSDAQFDKLADTAWGLNRRDVSVPFSPTASPAAASSGETSRPPSD